MDSTGQDTPKAAGVVHEIIMRTENFSERLDQYLRELIEEIDKFESIADDMFASNPEGEVSATKDILPKETYAGRLGEVKQAQDVQDRILIQLNGALEQLRAQRGRLAQL